MSLDAYFKEIKSNESITIKQQKTSTKEQLILSNLKLVVKIAHHYKGMGVDLEDLTQEGNYGLIEAAEKFNYDADNKFSTYAAHYIKMRMRNALNKHKSVKISLSHTNTINKIHKFINNYKTQYNIPPNIEQISEELGVTYKIVQNALRYQVKGSISLDQKIKEDSDDTIDKILDIENTVLSPIETMIKEDDKNHLQEILNKLDKREKDIIMRRFFEEETLQTIGDDIGMTPAGVKAIQDRTLKKLRTLI